ncbi:Coenzyme F420 hydrogenase/dehydrogenase, beta subunit C-terminal domain [Megamonas hypermegale]|uniref:Coenzyme F420 hydrogenase/dehydrogenase, beta subunit C-terminal domain n=1 Tax=Megamonas hypermegale TaxID=158847 RepID=UPI0026E9F623|nr:Coenzyme F420 hydrogenase/dehydrogenase, beta subunit C-terminal domain [Megamonas hypermegale]
MSVLEKNDKIILFKKKEDCCACGACYNICPKNAIEMEIDDYGFKYPKINENKCIGCGACKKVCAFQNIKETNEPLEILVSARKDNSKILQSASGGIFAVFAEKILKENGIVFGSALIEKNKILEPEHIYIDKLEDLPKLLGSKYVQSDINSTYKEARKFLSAGKKVLFSGTPCQIAGLKSFLGRKYDNLLTIDIICHGVPNAEFFKGYLKILEKQIKAKIIDFKFRDKKYGWGPYTMCIKFKKDNKIENKYFSLEEASYPHMFLYTESLRENCYRCKYTNKNRTGDITIGDYWGIENEHPDLLKENGGILDRKKGISAIIVNTEKGKVWLDKCKDELFLYSSTFEQVAKANIQLREPSPYGKYRDKIMQLYKDGGYELVDKFYYNKVIIKYIKKILIKKTIKKIMPEKIWLILKSIYYSVKIK